jgi:hypothetical protein
MKPPYEVFPYKKENIIKQLNKDKVTEAKLEYLKSKTHIRYFDKYLTALKAVTVVCEYNYIDRDYIEDYAAYYVRTFHEYKRKCCRLHFFSNKFTKDKFARLLKGEDVKGFDTQDLQEHYLGFIVIKPLPQTVFGKTCLKTYSEDDKRQYPIIRTYKANLFGIDLRVKSIAYQEQDKIVAACASSAIWSAFQGTGLLFQHSIPSPVEITKAATKNFPHANRHFPNEGLTAEQMAQAIRNVQLEPYLVDCKTENYDNLTSTIYAYLKGKIPMIFGFHIFHPDEKDVLQNIGQHAVTVTGMSLQGDKKKFHNDDFYLKSSRINKIYVHDDQVGNFAKMELDGTTVLFKDKDKQAITLTSSFRGTEKAKAIPKVIVVPLYHKIRIPFNSILKIVLKLDELIKAVGKAIKAPTDWEWDIFLVEVSDFKRDIRESHLEKQKKYEILTQELPRYMWRAICCINNERKYELLFDATDIEQGKLILRVIDYDKDFSMPFVMFAITTPPENIANIKVREIVEEIRKKL